MYITRISAIVCFIFTLQITASPIDGIQKPLLELGHDDDFPSLLDLSIDDANAMFSSGLVTSEDLVNAYLDRISEVNHILHAVGELNPDALDIARALDAERAAGHVRGPLHGIPMLLKDNIATGDQMNNTAGSVCMLGLQSPRDSTVVASLRKAGVVVLGKAAMSEWASARSSRNSTSNGWSGYGRQVLGAYHENQDPMGSSSGSGVSVSVGLAMASLGTETMGSIITPSTQNNLVGIKPTLGLCSRELIIPITIRQDTVGPMAKTVKDAAIILTAMAGKDPLDNYTMVQPFEEVPDYTKALNLAALKGARIGIPRNSILPYSTDDIAQMAAFEDAIQIMKTAGAIIVDNANFTGYEGDLWDNMDIIMESSGKVFISDFIAGIAEYLSKVTKPGSPIHSLQDLADCTMSDPREDYPQRDIADWDDALASNVTNDSEEIWQAYQRDLYFGREGGVVGALDRYNLDALILPSLSASVIPALGGLPIVTVPVGKQPDDTEVFSQPPYNLVLRGPNMPFGISFLGRQWSEETLIGLAYAFEQRTMIRKTVVPLIKPKTELKLQSRL